jgi:hypothetical protein
MKDAASLRMASNVFQPRGQLTYRSDYWYLGLLAPNH